MLASSGVQLVFQRLDVLIVGVFLGAAEAGIYAVAFRTAGLASILQTAVNATIAPRVSKLYWSDRGPELEAIDTHVPWTRVVEERKTTHRGREVDLVDHIARVDSGAFRRAGAVHAPHRELAASESNGESRRA